MPALNFHHLAIGDTSVVIDLSGGRLPAVLHWGARVTDEDAATLIAVSPPQRVSAGVDRPIVPSVLPTQAEGWLGTPGLEGSTSDGATTLRFSTTSVEGDESALTVTADDPDAALRLTIEFALAATGLLTVSVRLRNEGNAEFRLDRVDIRLPVPSDADEILHPYGRHLRDRAPQRQSFDIGTLLRESRGGKPGYSSPLLLIAGRTGFGFERGRAHGIHLAWSGSTRYFAERTAEGVRVLGAGEVLPPGELTLRSGEEYSSPPLVASWGDGLTTLSARIHEVIRDRPRHPKAPLVTLNTWEAVYFDHRLDRLLDLVPIAADLGVERFVLDDGWFLGRRDDTAGLGDWFVDPVVWPDGLRPLIDEVRRHGMQFGLWVEPEMVNPASRLARDHPDWLLGPPAGLPMASRQQQVLNLAHPDAWRYLLDRLDALLQENPISYLKWDHNRDLLEAVDHSTGRPVAHANVNALYALLDEIRARHPHVDIEACAGGGSRIDLALLDRSDRVWVSDCVDPIERLNIQRYTGLLLPPELMGSDIGEERIHSTHRVADLDARAGVALFGNLGLQWDLTRLDESARSALGEWIAYYKRHRELIASGRMVFADLADPTADVRGVVSADRSTALYSYLQVAASESYPPERVTLPGLDPTARYRVRLRWNSTRSYGMAPLAWAAEPRVLTGSALESVGLLPPVLYPGQLVLLEVERLSDSY